MSYPGKLTGSRKVLQTVRVVFSGAGTAQVSYDGGALGSAQTCNPTTWLQLFSSVAMNANVNLINTADDIGQLIDIGTGGTDGINNAAASTLFISELGGAGYQYIRIDGGTRISIKPSTINPSLNTTLVINFFQ